jgi:hypothetical protein
MGPGHHHEVSLEVSLRRWLTATIATIAAAALIGFVVLWPRGKAPDLGSGATLQLDARGHIVCNCPECMARANAANQPAANPVPASPSADTTLPALRVSATWAMDLLSKSWNSEPGTTKS